MVKKKRKTGEGTVRLRKDGRWEGRIVVDYDIDGLPITKNVPAKTESECNKKLNELKDKIGITSRNRVKSSMPFGEWMDFWYQYYCRIGLKTTTQEGYESRIYKHIIPKLGDIPLNKLTQNDLQKLYTDLEENGRLRYADTLGKGLSNRLVRSCHANCRTALQRAVDDGLIKTNPAIGCKLPTKKAREMQVLSKEELKRFFIQAKYDGYYEIFIMVLATGMRRGEEWHLSGKT